MDPGTALSIASLVLEACRTANELYRKFSDQRNQLYDATDIELEKELQNLRFYSQRLNHDVPLPQVGKKNTYINQHQEALKDLANTAAKTADEILAVWEELKPENGQNMLESFKKACSSKTRASQLKKLHDQFISCRDKIQFQLIACLKEGFDQLMHLSTNIYISQRQLGDDIQQTREEIINVLAINDKRFRGTIMGLKDGGAFTINNVPLYTPDSTHGQSTSSTMTAFNSGMGKGDSGATSGNFQYIIELVNQCLHFERISERQNAIKEAYVATFDWIFTDLGSEADTEAFSSFPMWLESGHGCYWIAGKAGSGKSTLMKKILESPMTRHHLQVWAGEKKLSMSSFFFWYLGSNLQKSREGMLRSLLSALLEQAPQIALGAMPELLIEASKLTPGSYLGQPSLSQLQRWFEAFMKLCESSGDTKVCFFIDGLDEYSGDKLELANLLLDLSHQTQAVKFVLASRPLSVFCTRFAQLPGLRVQDLTTSDIREYTNSLLQKSSSLVRDDDIAKLVAAISERSQGVFLWVVVVVKSVLEGLCDGDTVIELQQRVLELPTELRDLYQRMLESIGQRYQSEAAEMLLLAATAFSSTHKAHDTGAIDPLPAIQLFFAIKGCTTAMRAPIQTCSDEEVREMIDWLVPRLRSRCLGLIELRDRSKDPSPMGRQLMPSSKRLLSRTVEPFHRTAVEFLLDEEVYSLLTTLAGSAFDPFQSLFCSSIRMVKTAPSFFPESEGRAASELAPWYHVFETLFLSIDAKQRDRVIRQEYLSEFDRVLDTHWTNWAGENAPEAHKLSGWFSIVVCNRKTAQGNWIPRDGEDQGLRNLELDDKLFTMLLDQYMEIGYLRIIAVTVFPDQVAPLLCNSMLSRDHATLLLRLLFQLEINVHPQGWKTHYVPEVAVALAAILDAGADPNALDWRDSGRTLWLDFLASLSEFLTSSNPGTEDSGEVLVFMVRKLVDHGADLFVAVPLAGHLFKPSTYMRRLHGHITNQLTKPKREGVVNKKLTYIVDGIAAAAELLAEREEQAGVYSRRSRAAYKLRHSPARNIKRWIFGSQD